ncbi:hypothetical protein COU37_04280 [Candidatus Micrarchaeota archaeon CG10_big_fil_rev_8_21_14_0_10_45_29]|nr:MAG: hypothetical protein COU37_04280 [Candidatus Micrarchaeota archaeon CG10_big_fil_rev_8_21_14_0_10_45_29]
MPKKEWTVILHKAQEGGYWVDVPQLQGCISQGETKEEALKNIKEAIELYLETAGEAEYREMKKNAIIISKVLAGA